MHTPGVGALELQSHQGLIAAHWYWSGLPVDSLLHLAGVLQLFLPS